MVSAFGCVLTHNLLRRTFAKDGARESSVKKKGLKSCSSSQQVTCVWLLYLFGGFSAVGHVAVCPL